MLDAKIFPTANPKHLSGVWTPNPVPGGNLSKKLWWGQNNKMAVWCKSLREEKSSQLATTAKKIPALWSC